MEYTRETDMSFECEKMNIVKSDGYHCHSRMELIYVTDGSIRLRTDMGSVVYDVYRGDYALVKSGDVHRVFPNYKASVMCVRFPITFLNLSAGGYIRESFVIPREEMEKRPLVMKTVSSAFNLLFENNGMGAEAGLCSAIASVMQSLYPYRRTVVSVGDDDKERINNRVGISLETIEKFDRVVEYINENFKSSSLGLGRLSELSGMNKTFLSSVFPKLTGRRFKEYIHHLRINFAIELMTSTDKSISEVAYSSGFETIRSFNNVFKSVMHTTPSGFLSGLSGRHDSGIDTQIDCVHNDINKYKWTSNVGYEFVDDGKAVKVECNNKELKIWCHLRLRMLFFAGKSYRVSFKVMPLFNSAGEKADGYALRCDFKFPDSSKGIEHHSIKPSVTQLDGGWYKCECIYRVPDYYIPSTDDIFSVYSDPLNDLAVSFIVKEICVVPV